MVLKKGSIFIFSALLIFGIFGFVFSLNSGASISTENSDISKVGDVIENVGIGDVNTECNASGFNFGIERFECDFTSPVSDDGGYNISVVWTDTCDSVSWTSNPDVAGVLSKEDDLLQFVHDGGISGGFSKSNIYDISHITFCGNNEVVEPYCGDGIVNGVEECDDGNDVDGDGCSANCALEACVDSGEGPVTSDLTVIKLTDTCSVKIEATETDECSNIIAAEYFLGGVNGTCGAEGTGTPMDPKDDDFDSMIEEIIKNNVVVSDGSINVHVRGKDFEGNWGACKTVRVDIDCLPPYYPTCEEGDDLQHDNGIALNGECNPEHILVCGDDPLLSANICDDQSRIQLAEYFIDEDTPINWQGIPMDASDGVYDERCEDVSATIDLGPLEEGTHYVELHGKDGQENWGKFTFNPEISFIKDTMPPETTKQITFFDDAYFNCDMKEANGHALTDGCYYVKPGTNITLSAVDPDTPDHEIAGNPIINWEIWYSNDCTIKEPDWTLMDSGTGEVDEDVMLTLENDSCHLIKYWASDGCTNLEEPHYELDIVDSKAPITEKEVGIPKVACEPGDEEDGGDLIALLDAVPSPGTNLRQINGAYSQGSCAVNTGLAFDGTNLLMTCWYYNIIDVLSPADGSLQGTITVPGYDGLMANAWDGTRDKLWQCAEHNKVLLVDTSDGSSVLYTHDGISCTDGLAYDGSDDTLWLSPDVSGTIYHYRINGDNTLTQIGSFSLSGKIGSCGNSGIAVGGDKLYLANNGCSEIYEAEKDLSSSTLFAAFPERLEDMECDDITFASQGVGAIWSQDAYDRIINAYAIPQGKCGFGGLPPEPQDTQCDYYITSETPITLNCTDQTPHPIDNVTLQYRYRFNENCDNLESSDWSGWQIYEGPFTFKEDSCHELEYYCVDALGNEEVHQFEIDVVDTQSPVVEKEIVGPWSGQCPPKPDSDDVCYIDGVTEIRVTVTDPEPHPVDDVTCRWTYNVDGGDYIMGGQGLGGEFTVHFPEQSEHNLIIECKDALGNRVHDEEVFFVDKTPPVTTKTYGEPFFSEEPEFLQGSFGTSGTGTAGFVDDSAHIFAPLITDFPPSNEGRVRVELTGMTLDELDTISWDANVLQGYLPHVDVFLDNGKVLVFEYAKVDPVLCDNAPYPTGNLNTFGDKGIVDDSAYAWLSSGPAGPCGDETFDANHNSLADWKLSDGGQDVLAIEIEVDGWIATSEADVNNIMINGEEVIIDPEFESNAVHWINSDTPITLTVDDAGPHKSGIDRTQYRTTLVDDDYCLSQTVCQSAEGTGDWSNYEDPFSINEESCHLIEYYSVDNVNKTEMVNKQCVFVDNSAPETDKLVGEPKSLCEGGEEFCGPEGEWQSWFITGETNVTLSCEDPLPHPVDHEKLCFAISWHVDREACAEAQGVWNEDKGFCYLTDNYVEEFVEGPGVVEEDQYYCLYLDETNEFEFNFLEDSLHNIEWFCEDALGNKGEVNVEWDNVDSKGPEIIIRNPSVNEREVEMCAQSIVATINDKKSGVMSAWAELWNSSEVKVREVNLTKDGGQWEAIMDKALPAGDYILKVCAVDNNGNENCVEIEETLVETVFVEYITPAVCGIDPEEGGVCDFTYNICMRGGNGIKFWMNKLGDIITPGMMGATISDEDGNAVVGLRHESGLSQKECEDMSEWDNETFWDPETELCWFISGDAEFLELSCQEINGREKFNLHLELDGEDVSLIGPGVHNLEYWIKSIENFEGCVEPPPAPEEDHVVINEFVSDPLNESNEWVELYNPTDSNIDLTDWAIYDNIGVRASLSGTLNTGDYLIVEFNSSVLNNAGDIIELKDELEGSVDSVSYGNWEDANESDNAPVPVDGQSTGRSPNGVDTDNDLSDFAIFDTPTPGVANV
jgi:cysteine-rich repeat protein